MAQMTMQEIGQHAYNAGFTNPTQLATMIAMSMAESGGRSDANNAGLNSNGTVDYGLWQINGVHNPDLDRIYDPAYNAQQAKRVWDQQGYGAWSVYKNGRYQKYMNDATRVARAITSGTGKQMEVASKGAKTAPQTSRQAADSFLVGAINAAKAKAMSFVDGMQSTLDEQTESDVPGRDVESQGVRVDPTAQSAANRANSVLDKGKGQVPVQQEQGLLEDELVDDVKNLDGLWDIPEFTAEEVQQAARDTGLTEKAARAYTILRKLGFDGTIGGKGARDNPSDHPDGRALDVMTNDDTEYGWKIADFFHRFRNELGIKYIIFDDKIASASRGWQWRDYTHPNGATTNPTLRHLDHVHISVKR